MKILDYVIQDEVGMHARPAGKLVQELNKYRSKIMVSYQGKKANAKSIINLMALGLKGSSKVAFEIEGDDEDKVHSELLIFLEKEKI